MLPRWLAAVGFLGLCTSFACFPPIAVAPIGTIKGPTGATPRPKEARRSSPRPSPSPSPTPSVDTSADMRAFAITAGEYRYEVVSAPSSGAPVVGERTIALREVRIEEGRTSGTGVSTVKLNVPGFTALDREEAALTVTLSAEAFTVEEAGQPFRTFPFPLDGRTWYEGGLVGTAGALEVLTLPTLGGRTFPDARRITFTTEAQPARLVADLWFAPDVGLIKRVDYFEHQGQAWEATSSLAEYPVP